MVSRLETNFTRLLHRCEAMASEKQYADWRFEKYIGALQDYLGQLRKTHRSPSAEVLKDYTKKVDLLKGILEAEKMPSSTAKAVAADLFTPSANGVETSNTTRKLYMQTQSRFHQDMRQELFGTKTESEVRQRKLAGSATGVGTEDAKEDFDTIIKHHQSEQEKVAKEMLHLAHHMKENAKTARKIVQKDNEKLADSNRQADTNYAKLKVESERLETHVNKSCNWWVWILLFLVSVTFIWMILFMRMFPKR